jgi:hypothetical protein
MLYREITAVCSQIHTKHTYILCGRNVEISCAFANSRKKKSDGWFVRVPVHVEHTVSNWTVLLFNLIILSIFSKVCLGSPSSVKIGEEINRHVTRRFVHVYDDMIYLLTAVGLTPGGSSTVHIYTQTVHRTTQ